MPTLTTAAIHESGHAVCALLLGKSYGCQVFDLGDGKGAGHAGSGELPTAPLIGEYSLEEVKICGAGRTMPEIVTDCTIMAAGSVATWMHARAILYGKPVEVTTSDRRMIWAEAGRLFGTDDGEIVEAFTVLAIARAKHVLAPMYYRMMQVARALEERKRLAADDVARIAFPEADNGRNRK